MSRKNFKTRARIVLGRAGWLVTGWMDRRIEAIGSRRNSAAPQRKRAVQQAAGLLWVTLPPLVGNTWKGWPLPLIQRDPHITSSPRNLRGPVNDTSEKQNIVRETLTVRPTQIHHLGDLREAAYSLRLTQFPCVPNGAHNGTKLRGLL